MLCLCVERGGKARRNQDISLDRTAHCQDPADLVDGRTNDSEIETVLAADIAVEDVADMQREIDLGRCQTAFSAAAVELGDAFFDPGRGGCKCIRATKR